MKAGVEFKPDDAMLLGRIVAFVTVLVALFDRSQSMLLSPSLTALIGLVAVLCLSNRDDQLSPFQLRPAQGWRYWIVVAIKFAVVIAVIIAVCGAIYRVAG